MKKVLSALIALGVVFVFCLVIGWNHYSARGAPQGIPIDADDIGGQVHVKKGSAAGVWVIAQADIANTNYRKIVVTNWRGQFVIPDLPDATYDVWVRGYGLKDSPIVKVSPGTKVQLQAELASTPQEAAQIYPAAFWYALLEPPAKDMFPGTMTEDDPGNGIPAELETQAEWVSILKRGDCMQCHQMGTKHTRGHDRVTPLQWELVFRLPQMTGGAEDLGREVAAEVFADWAARISEPDEENEIGTLSHKGEVPPEPPSRPGTRIERSIVITQWDWGDGLAYAHDEISTDKRNPTLYPNGRVYGVDFEMPRLHFADPVTNEVGFFETPFVPGFEPLQLPQRNSGGHNPMFDDQGRVWITREIHFGDVEEIQPDFCIDGSRGDVPLPEPSDDLTYFDTATEEFVLFQTCQGTHHLQFDFNGLLWPSSAGSGTTAYWIDPSKFDPNDPSTLAEAQNWRLLKVDSDGDGVGDATADINGDSLANGYGIIPNPVDGSIWMANGGFPGQVVRFDPATEMSEVYVPPAPGLSPRGIDATTDGIIWTCLADSSHVARFDRSQCAQTFGLGDQCPEGWTLWELPGPHFKGVPEVPGNADFPYFTWVDQFNTLGLGENMVVCTGSNSDSLIVFNPETEEFTKIVTPFPLTMFTRGLDGRIDDPDAGWKGRGWWLDNGQDPIKHLHHEPNDRHHVIGWAQHLQLRPHPLAH